MPYPYDYEGYRGHEHALKEYCNYVLKIDPVAAGIVGRFLKPGEFVWVNIGEKHE